MVEPTTGKDAVNMANTEVPEQEAPEQVALEQSLPGTLSEGQDPENDQSMPEQTTGTMSSTQGGLLDTVAKGKLVVMSSITGLNQGRKQAGAKQAIEFDDDIVEEIQGHLQDGRQHVYIYREHGDHYIYHEEISIDEETVRVEQATKRLIEEV
jgi:hypothetical protein